MLSALDALAFDWGDAYLLSYFRDRWVALRRDNHRFITADTLAGLRTAIQADYQGDPVSRECDPPGATDYLDFDDYDDIPDAETLIILRGLQIVFPLWTIINSGQLRAWIAWTPEQTPNNVGRDWPPWGNMSPP